MNISLIYKKLFPLSHQGLSNYLMDIMNNVLKVKGLKLLLIIFLFLFAVSSGKVKGQTPKTGKAAGQSFQIPRDYLREAENIPSFWITTVDDVNLFLKKNVHRQLRLIFWDLCRWQAYSCSGIWATT